MSNPDKGGGFNVSSFAVSLPIGILFLVILVALFQFKQSIPSMRLVLWLGIPIIGFIIVFGVNLTTQYSNCRSIDAGKAALGALPTVGTMLIGLLICSFATCRIPVASVFTPLLIGDSVSVTRTKTNNNTNSVTNSVRNSIYKECCTQKLSVYTIEQRFPIIQGISYGFYLMFAAFFGIVIGNGYATIC
jgi:hypothetical protein